MFALFDRGLVLEIDRKVDPAIVIRVEHDRVGFDNRVPVVGVFVPEDEQIDPPPLSEVFELVVVVAAPPDHEVPLLTVAISPVRSAACTSTSLRVLVAVDRSTELKCCGPFVPRCK